MNYWVREEKREKAARAWVAARTGNDSEDFEDELGWAVWLDVNNEVPRAPVAVFGTKAAADGFVAMTGADEAEVAPVTLDIRARNTFEGREAWETP